ncbi:MAG: L,D-transpeptidase family protein [Bacteroidales bacterium]|jgi:murein L,D-transpeptidase YcbB/YkuD|nr:L,D-transpeptidase family protein [Bacteroidales bacterium]
MTKNHSRNTRCISLFIFSCLFAFACEKQTTPIVITSAESMMVTSFEPMIITSSDPIVQEFYKANQKTLIWVSSKNDINNANEWLAEMKLAKSVGFVSYESQIEKLQGLLLNKKSIDKGLRDFTDQEMTGLVLNFLRDLQQGSIQFDYDEVNVSRDSVYINQLLQKSQNNVSVSTFIKSLESKDPDYWVLKNYLNDSITTNDTLKYKLVLLALNYSKYITINQKAEYILVNIPETQAKYYRNGLLTLSMKTVAGRKYTQTPTISSYITSIVTFPHWYVPHSIAVNEILPKVQKDKIYLNKNNFEVINTEGIIVNDSVLIWDNFTSENFPYYFRQATGANNAMGVLKFDLQNPFSIYLHSTSHQSAFANKYRFLSHGCIRLENPIDLATSLLPGQLDVENLKRGTKDVQSKNNELPEKVPVFIIYSPAIVLNNKVDFLPDIYGLIQ